MDRGDRDRVRARIEKERQRERERERYVRERAERESAKVWPGGMLGGMAAVEAHPSTRQ